MGKAYTVKLNCPALIIYHGDLTVAGNDRTNRGNGLFVSSSFGGEVLRMRLLDGGEDLIVMACR